MKKGTLSILSFLLGLGLIVFAILIYTETIKDIKLIDIFTKLSIIGLLSFVVGFLMANDYRKIKNKSYRSLVFLEMIIVILAIIVGFILPMFDIYIIKELGSGSLWLFISLLLYSSVSLYGGIKQYKKITFAPFIIHVATIVLSVYIYERKLIETYINYSLIAALILMGIYLIYLSSSTNKRKKAKNENRSN